MVQYLEEEGVCTGRLSSKHLLESVGHGLLNLVWAETPRGIMVCGGEEWRVAHGSRDC